jgi:hypothetical protein
VAAAADGIILQTANPVVQVAAAHSMAPLELETPHQQALHKETMVDQDQAEPPIMAAAAVVAPLL